MSAAPPPPPPPPSPPSSSSGGPDEGGMGAHEFVLLIGGACAAWATLVSLSLIYKHVRNFSRPTIQVRVVRILLMAPIYSILSFATLAAKEYAIFFDLVRDTYEAYTIFQFYMLLETYLGEELISATRAAAAAVKAQQERMRRVSLGLPADPDSDYDDGDDDDDDGGVGDAADDDYISDADGRGNRRSSGVGVPLRTVERGGGGAESSPLLAGAAGAGAGAGGRDEDGVMGGGPTFAAAATATGLTTTDAVALQHWSSGSGGSNFQAVGAMLEGLPRRKHPWPLKYCVTFKPGKKFLWWTRFWILQFAILKPLNTLIALITHYAGDHYGEGSFSPASSYLYLTIIDNFSITMAMYYLVLFYESTEDQLKPIKPLPKFICIKLVIFVSFWQGVVIAGFEKAGLIKGVGSWSEDDVATGLQDFLIVVEMFFISLAHHKVFGYTEYHIANKEPFLRSLLKGRSTQVNSFVAALGQVSHPVHDLTVARETFTPLGDHIGKGVRGGAEQLHADVSEGLGRVAAALPAAKKDAQD